MRVGVLALQGDVREHAAALADVGAEAVAVRRPADLSGLGGLVVPGGESTTLSILLGSSGLAGPLQAAVAGGLAVLGTCAGLILLARRVLDGRPDQLTLGALDVTVRRNGYGRQRQSFEADLEAPGLGGDRPLPAVFIRAPRLVEVGPGVEVLAVLPARAGGSPDAAVVRAGAVVACTFHPELTPDRRVHELFVDLAAATAPTGGRSRTVR